jgi:hypothetical protein
LAPSSGAGRSYYYFISTLCCHTPSYFPHISSYLPHISSYFFIFASYLLLSVHLILLFPLAHENRRHTHITLAIAAGFPLKNVSSRAGHSTIAIACDIYAVPITAIDVDIANSFERLLKPAGA